MRGLIAVEDVMAALSADQRMAIEARGLELLAEVERRLATQSQIGETEAGSEVSRR